MSFFFNGSPGNNTQTIVDLSGYVPKTTTVNGHALTGNIVVAAGDVAGLGTMSTQNADNVDITGGIIDAGNA
jgi:hypothetical protein